MNYSEKIFEMLGVKPNQEFYMINFGNKVKYKIDENLKVKCDWNGWKNSQYDISDFLTGNCEIIKIHKPTKDAPPVFDYEGLFVDIIG